MTSDFLKAEWRKLAIANYSVEPSLLKKFIPRHTELDLWENKCYVSLVGFMFCNTKILGMKIPFHINFEEVNLRFYVKHKTENNEWKRGVVFLKEIVPTPAITIVANTIYKEHYATMPMKHHWKENNDTLEVSYQWKHKGWHSFKITAALGEMEIPRNSEAEFITEHYWGYTKISESKTSEYEVQHPRWKTYSIRDYYIAVDFGKLYGKEFEFLKAEKPISVFLAEGSEIKVKSGRKL